MTVPMFATEMVADIIQTPKLTIEHERARIMVLRNLITVARMQCAYAHHNEHTYTKENQWREIHRAALDAYTKLTGKEVPRILQTIPWHD